MNSNIGKSLASIVALWCLAEASTAFAQTATGSTLFNPSVDLSAGTQNMTVGNVGGVFLTTSLLWPHVNWLGYYDKDGDGLANSHQVALWRVGGVGGASSTPDALVTIPAGTEAPLYNGYRWVQLTSDVDLWYGTWYTISAQTDGVDTWGDLINGSQAGWNEQYVGLADAWSRAGRYDSTASWPNSPGTQINDPNDAIFPVANMGFNLPLVVPEPGSLSLLAVGCGLLLWRRR